jgi:hypothetical protein
VLPIIFQIVNDCRHGTLQIGPSLVALLLAPIGLITIMIYLFVHVGDPLAFACPGGLGPIAAQPVFWIEWGLRRDLPD